MPTTKNRLQRRLANWIVKDLFNGIDEDDILFINEVVDISGRRKIEGVYLGKKKLDADTVEVLRENAERFNDSSLWELIKNQVKNEANLRMFKKGITADDILMGKCCLYVLDIIEKTVKKISRL